MIDAQDFCKTAIERGFTFYAGVPCSFLKPLLNQIISHEGSEYIAASSEGEAVGMGSGAYLAGKKAVVMCQNSGLGNMVNPLTSLNYPFRIPLLLVISLRGEPGLEDEPQHELMGQITGRLLDTLGIPWELFPKKPGDLGGLFGRIETFMEEKGLPYALILKKGTVAGGSEVRLAAQHASADRSETWVPPRSGCMARMARIEAIGIIRDTVTASDAIIATTGKIGRELYTQGDAAGQLYVVGSMGCASGVGFGVQRALSPQRVVILDGDGAALMKMGTMATIGHYRPRKLVHVILDNESYESTGGQRTVSSSVDFCRVAAACGYAHIARPTTKDELRRSVLEAVRQSGPALIHVKVEGESDPRLGRPKTEPTRVKTRFMDFLRANGNVAIP